MELNKTGFQFKNVTEVSPLLLFRVPQSSSHRIAAKCELLLPPLAAAAAAVAAAAVAAAAADADVDVAAAAATRDSFSQRESHAHEAPRC